MKQPSHLWRLVIGFERLLPASVREAAGATVAIKTRARNRWTALVAVFPGILVAVVNWVRCRADMAEMWPVWRPMLLDLLVVIVGAVVVAGVAFSVYAWRNARHA